jgi:hypothetical protein
MLFKFLHLPNRLLLCLFVYNIASAVNASPYPKSTIVELQKVLGSSQSSLSGDESTSQSGRNDISNAILKPLEIFRDRIGSQEEDPEMIVIDNFAFPNWKGAENVDSWVLQTGDTSASPDHQHEVTWRTSSMIKTYDLNASIEFPKDCESYIRAIAFDKEGKVLGVTRIVKLNQVCVLLARRLLKVFTTLRIDI